MRIFITIFFIIFLSYNAFPLNMDKIVAYPVPFNPKKQVLHIGYEPGTPPETIDRVEIDIRNINGDTVFSRVFSSLSASIQWNGENSKGKKVKSGLYIIIVKVENTANGDSGNKIIKILVRE